MIGTLTSTSWSRRGRSVLGPKDIDTACRAKPARQRDSPPHRQAFRQKHAACIEQADWIAGFRAEASRRKRRTPPVRTIVVRLSQRCTSLAMAPRPQQCTPWPDPAPRGSLAIACARTTPPRTTAAEYLPCPQQHPRIMRERGPPPPRRGGQYMDGHAIRPKHPMHLPKQRGDIRNMLEYIRTEDDIEYAIRQGQCTTVVIDHREYPLAGIVAGR